MMQVSVELFSVGHCQERAWFADRSSFFRRLTFPAMVALVRHPRHGTLLFDTGYGPALQQARSWAAKIYGRLLPFALSEAQYLTRQLQERGLNSEDLYGVMLSHFHPDHVGGLREVAKVPIFASGKGLAALQARSAYRQARAIFFPELLPADMLQRLRPIEALPLRPTAAGLPEGHDLFGDGTALAIDLPGHALGQFGLFCQTAHGPVLLCADAAWVRANFAALQFPAWPVRFLAEDWSMLLQQMRQLQQWQRQHPTLTIVPTHCEESIRAWQAR